MERSKGMWGGEFRFSPPQLERLRQDCWKREGDRKRAGAFLAAAEPIIGKELIFIQYGELAPNRDAVLQKLQSLTKTISKLNERLADIDEYTAMDLNAGIREQQCVQGSGAMNENRVLQQYGVAALDIWEMEEIIGALLGTIGRSTARLLEPEGRCGPKPKWDKSLALRLARLYLHVFGKRPSAAENGNFSMFIKELNVISGHAISQDTIKWAIKEVEFN